MRGLPSFEATRIYRQEVGYDIFSDATTVPQKLINVYGKIYNARLLKDSDIIKSIKKDLSDAHPDEVIRIVSGILNCDIYNPCGDDFKKHYQEKNLRYEAIFGPVASGYHERCKLRNKLLELAKESIVDIYLAKIRRELHMRIVGEWLLHGETPHPTVDGIRFGYYIDTRIYEGEERQRAVFAIKKRIREFEAMKAFSHHIQPKNIDKIPLLENWDIVKIDRMAQKEGLSFDLLTQERILEFREKLKQP